MELGVEVDRARRPVVQEELLDLEPHRGRRVLGRDDEGEDVGGHGRVEPGDDGEVVLDPFRIGVM